MSTLSWLYREFGLDAIYGTGRDAYLIIFARTCRMVAHGANSLVLGLFLSELKFSDYQIGLFLTLTLLGDVFLGSYLTLIADRVGRRKILLAGSVLMVASGIVFAVIENFWVLLLAAVLGVVSATGGDFGPFRSIEESILAQLTTLKTRADVLSWYVTTSTLGSAIGSEASGRLVNYLQSRQGWTLADAYHTLFWSYAITGLMNVVFVLLLSSDCELYITSGSYSRVSQCDPSAAEARESLAQDALPIKSEYKQDCYQRLWSRISSNLSEISLTTRSVMYKLWFLLAVDSLADGMVPYTLTNYYVDEKFHPAKSTLGDATGGAYLLGAFSTVFAGPLSRKIGLINTMVFTHIPSSAAVLLFAAPTSLWLTIILLFIRAGLNNLDQAPRSAFIAAVVKPNERTAVMGLTSMIRTLSAMAGPSFTGLLAGNQQFWIAFVVAGACRLVYDVGLYALFVNMKLHETEDDARRLQSHSRSPIEDEEMVEMDNLAHSVDDRNSDPSKIDNSARESDRNKSGDNVMSDIVGKVHRRSPSPFFKPP